VKPEDTGDITDNSGKVTDLDLLKYLQSSKKDTLLE